MTNRTPASFDASDRQRADWLDLFKTLLVYGMITAHVIQLLTFGPSRSAIAVAEFVNLITFSGFMLAFGMGIGLSSGARATGGIWRRVRPVVLLLLATYISSFAFAILVDREAVTPEMAVELLTLQRLFGWSEFLASFFVLYLVLLVARPVFVFIARHWPLLLGAIILCGLSTLVVTSARVPVIATLIGTTNFASFPLLPYLPWFLLGICLGGRPLRLWHLLPAAAATGGYFWWLYHFGEAPQRFPPSALFVAGPALFLLVYLAASRFIARGVRVPTFLLLPGRHVLSFLLVSNLVIFGSRRMFGRFVRDDLRIVIVALAIILGITLMWIVIDAVRRRRA